MPEEFNYTIASDDPFPNLRKIEVFERRPGYILIQENSVTVFRFLHWQTGAEFLAPKPINVKGICWPHLPTIHISSPEFNAIISISSIDHTSEFEYQGHKYVTKHHAKGYQISTINESESLGFLVESWRDSDLKVKRIFTIYATPNLDKFLMMALLLAPFSDTSRHSLGLGPPIFKPQLQD